MATQSVPHEVDVIDYLGLGGTKSEIKKWVANPRFKKVVCLPFYTILSAIDNPTVDYFSLDIEGAELDVLKTIPWDKVDIKVLSIDVGENV